MYIYGFQVDSLLLDSPPYQILCTFLFYILCAISPTYLILLDIIAHIIYGKDNILYTIALCTLYALT